jgi:hypothetical protein
MPQLTMLQAALVTIPVQRALLGNQPAWLWNKALHVAVAAGIAATHVQYGQIITRHAKPKAGHLWALARDTLIAVRTERGLTLEPDDLGPLNVPSEKFAGRHRQVWDGRETPAVIRAAGLEAAARMAASPVSAPPAMISARTLDWARLCFDRDVAALLDDPSPLLCAWREQEPPEELAVLRAIGADLGLDFDKLVEQLGTDVERQRLRDIENGAIAPAPRERLDHTAQ